MESKSKSKSKKTEIRREKHFPNKVQDRPAARLMAGFRPLFVLCGLFVFTSWGPELSLHLKDLDKKRPGGRGGGVKIYVQCKSKMAKA